MKRIKLVCIILTIAAMIACVSCSAAAAQPQAVSYADAAHWVALPTNADKPVDVFYLYPTVWAKRSENDPNICEIDNKLMLAGGKAAYQKQATAFEITGNVYAPYYRQADAAYCLSISDEEQTKLLDGIPKADVFASLDYYFENYNNGRPFILAGHSQGSNMLLFVLSEYMKEHPDIYKRMVAAYVIGYSVTDEFLQKNTHLKFAQGAEDTGVIISYNTEAPNVTEENIVLEKGARAINPITWTTDETRAEASQSLGARIEGSKVENFADAKVDLKRGVVTCSTVNPEDYYEPDGLFAKGVYHGQDYPFYYYDIEANAQLRANRYLDDMVLQK